MDKSGKGDAGEENLGFGTSDPEWWLAFALVAPVVSVVSVVSVDLVSTEMTGLQPRRNVRFARVAVRGVGLL